MVATETGDLVPDLTLEDSVRQAAGDPKLVVCGLDEVGVGALAGPVMAAAVALGKAKSWHVRLNDSKKLSKKARAELFKLITKHEKYGLGVVFEKEIADWGIAAARERCLLLAYHALLLKLGDGPLGAVVDDRRLHVLRNRHPEWFNGGKAAFVDHADEKSLSVAAASIVAKEYRDTYMKTEAVQFSLYGFERHVGYGTPQHIAALKKHGPCSIHRRAFLRNILGTGV